MPLPPRLPVLFALLTAACGTSSPPTRSAPSGTAASPRYDAATGRCITPDGTPTLRACALVQVAASGDGECCDLAGQTLSALDGSPTPRWTNLRGADLSDVIFPAYGAPKSDARADGADLRGARDEYGMALTVTVDAHSRLDATCTRSPHPGDDASLFVAHCPAVAPADTGR